MKVEIKLYKTFDPELYALSAYGIKVTSLIKTALKHYVRGEYVHFHIPRSLVYDFDMKKRTVHLAMEITDEQSIKFLRNEIKPRLRSAFLKSLIRGSFTTPQLGVFFKNEGVNKEDTRLIKMSEFEDLSNLKVLEVHQSVRRDYSIPLLDENGQVSNSTKKEDSQQPHKQTSKKKKKKKRSNNNHTPNVKSQQHVDTPVEKQQAQQEKPQQNTDEQTVEKRDELQKAPLENRYGIEVHPPSESSSTPEPQVIMEEEGEDEDAGMFAAINNLMS